MHAVSRAPLNKALAVTSAEAYNSRMSKFDDLEKEARALSAKEKAALARVLIDDLDPVSDPKVEELWLEEARRRYDAYRRGEMHSISGDEAMARARSRLR
jgi:putative addiction module component (TIGR02574 family)